METVPDACAQDARRLPAIDAREGLWAVERIHLQRQNAELGGQLAAERDVVASLRGALERLMVQRDVLDAAAAIVDAAYCALGDGGAL